MFLTTESWYFKSHRLELAKYLHKAGVTITVGTRLDRRNPETAEDAEISYFPIPFERSLKNPLRDLLASVEVARVISREQPDLVHVVAIKPILATGLAVLLFPKTRFLHAFAGMGYLFSSTDRRARLMKRLVKELLKGILRRKNSLVLVQNDADKSFLTIHGLASAQQISMIPGSGIDIKKYHPEKSDFGNDEICCVVLPARMIRDKGVMEFVDAARQLVADGVEAIFALVGGVDKDNPASLSETEIRSWVEERIVEWWGHHDDMPAVFRRANIVCLPSYREGLPKALLEAAASGKPLVSTDVPGCREICIDDVTGISVPPRNVPLLASALKRMIDDDSLRARCGARARKLVEERYAIDKIGAETMSLYLSIFSQEN